jgi:4-hydroxy-tetrahydrodipicolinate synthase
VIPAKEHPFRGIYAATLTPFAADGSIDEERLAAHFRSVTAEPGIVGILCNGHAGENILLTRQERRRVIEMAAATIGATHIIVSGVVCEATAEAELHSRDAAEAGADAILVFPPFSWALSQDDAMALTHHRAIAEASGLPLMLFQAGTSSALAYTPEVLERLVQLPSVVAIKEGSWESNAYDRHRRLVKAVAPHVEMMASGDEHLLSCFAIGSEGSLVSLAAIIPREIVALDRAMREGDLLTARSLHERVQPLANAIYGTAPGGWATARLKACMVLLGQWPSGTPRAPITDLPGAEIDRLKRALQAAKFLSQD